MNRAGPLALFTRNEAELGQLASALVPFVAAGDLVLLKGPLGAGKTSFARSFVRTLARDPALEVPSPSFALVQPYLTGAGPLLHADLYRIEDPGEIGELGLDDDPAARVLVEWPERAPCLAGRAAMTVALSIPKGGMGRYLALDFPRRRPAPGLLLAMAPWTVT